MSWTEEAEETAQAADPATSATTLGQLAGRSLSLAKLVAGNPSATPRILRCIAMSWKEARAEVARHPELERTLAAVLGMEHPAALCENPSIPPRIASRRALPRKVLAHLLAQQDPPRWLLPALVGHPQPCMRELAAGYAKASAEVVSELAGDRAWQVRAAAARHPALAAAALARLARDERGEVRGAVAEREGLPAELQRSLAADLDPFHVRASLAGRATDEKALLILARGSDVLYAAAVAGNPAAPPAALEHLATLEWQDVLVKVAGNPRTPAPVLLRLLEGPQGRLRFSYQPIYRAAIENPSLPAAHFSVLAAAPTMEMRFLIAQCPRTPAPILRALAVADPDDRVRSSAAENPACALADDAGARLVRTLARDSSAAVRRAVARRTGEAAILAQLAQDASSQVRAAVAGSAHAGPALLAKLAADLDLGVRAAVARNAAAAATSLRALMGDDASEVASLAMCNPSLPVEEMMDRLGELPRQPLRVFHGARRLAELGLGDAAWQRIRRARHPHVEEVLASCASVPPAIAEELVGSAHEETRRALALHTADRGVLLRLAVDDASRVRLALAQRLELPRRPARSAALAEALVETGRVLALDEVDEVRAQVATSSRDAQVLARLAGDAARAVALVALGNPATPPPLLLEALRRGGDEAAAARGALIKLGHPRAARRPRRD